MNRSLSHLFYLLFGGLLLSSFSSCDKSDATDDSDQPPSDLIAYWAFDGSGADSSGNGHTATLNNLVSAPDRFGNPKGAYYFNGVNGFASVSDTEELRLNNTNFSITAWIKTDLNKGILLSKRVAGADNGWQTSISESPAYTPGVASFGPGGGSSNAWGTKTVSLSHWHMIALVYQQASGTLSIYIDGALDNTTSGILSPNNAITANLFIGKDNPTNSHLKGVMDDVKVFRKSLSTSEIKQLYESSKGPSEQLIAYWPFDGNGNDLSGNGNTAVPHNLTLTSDRFCNPTGAYYFNGINGYATVADAQSLRLSNTDFTLNAWVKMDSYDDSYGTIILSKRKAGFNNGWVSSISGYLENLNPLGVISFGPGGGNVNAWGTVRVNLHEWHMVTSVYKLSTQTLNTYVDGVFDNTSTGILSPNGTITNSLQIGRDEATNLYYLHGALDDVRMYGRALSAEQVKALYNTASGGCSGEE